MLFSFESSGSSNIELVPHEDRFKDYLLLETTGPNRYQISLAKSIDLNILNPRLPPVRLNNIEVIFYFLYIFMLHEHNKSEVNFHHTRKVLRLSSSQELATFVYFVMLCLQCVEAKNGAQ